MPAEIEANRLAFARAHHPHGRSAAILLVVGVHDQEQIQCLDEIEIDLVGLAGHGEHHAQEIFAIPQIVLWIDEWLADRLLVAEGSDRGQFRHQPVNRDFDLRRVARVERILVECRQRTTTELRMAIGCASRGKPL